ncbi:ATP-dependent DNA ligase [Virgisporangium aurantiacum]|uniref:ATP-dependent DNA ligase n=1 Tax=Virgisporangium aurantiacum TaxID=175570 RepID=UPI00194E6628|nr:hypothetical protein [Virgisporangium aurantiacum]
MPDLIRPMLAAPVRCRPHRGGRTSSRFDGVRAVTYIRAGRVRVLSRNHNGVTTTYLELAETAHLLGDRRAVVDGEIVALETGDVPSFARLQNRMLLCTFMILNVAPSRGVRQYWSGGQRSSKLISRIVPSGPAWNNRGGPIVRSASS